MGQREEGNGVPRRSRIGGDRDREEEHQQNTTKVEEWNKVGGIRGSEVEGDGDRRRGTQTMEEGQREVHRKEPRLDSEEKGLSPLCFA